MEKMDNPNSKLDYSNVAIGSIFCLSAIINNNDLDFAIGRAEFLLNIDKKDYYNQFVKTVNLFLKRYINNSSDEMSDEIIDNKDYISVHNIKYDDVEYNLLINKYNYDEIIIAIMDDDKLIIEKNREKILKIVYLLAREMTIVLE